MSRRVYPFIYALVAAAVAAGCAQVGSNTRTVSPKRGPICETASGHATSFGRATSQLHAQTAMRQQAAEIRGELLQGGLRRIRVGRPTGDCQPLPGAFRGMGLAHCRSYAQVCGQ
jgi:hypothetical protein